MISQASVDLATLSLFLSLIMVATVFVLAVCGLFRGTGDGGMVIFTIPVIAMISTSISHPGLYHAAYGNRALAIGALLAGIILFMMILAGCIFPPPEKAPEIDEMG